MCGRYSRRQQSRCRAKGCDVEGVEMKSLRIAPYKVGTVQFASKEAWAIDAGFIKNELRISLSTWLARGVHPAEPRRHVSAFEFPTTWKQHLKQDFYSWLYSKRFGKVSDWLQKKWPVHKTRLSEEFKYLEGPIYICPHANVPWPKMEHIKFLRLPYIENAESVYREEHEGV